MTINNSAEIFLTAMVFDDVFGRHPKLRCVSMEHGAFWVPSWLRAMDFAAGALRRGANPDALPSKLARERIRVSPFAGEPVGWIVDNVGPEMIVFATDFPHPEGGSDPIAKFEATMTDCSEATMAAFYRGNMAAFMGLAPRRSAARTRGLVRFPGRASGEDRCEGECRWRSTSLIFPESKNSNRPSWPILL